MIYSPHYMLKYLKESFNYIETLLKFIPLCDITSFLYFENSQFSRIASRILLITGTFKIIQVKYKYSEYNEYNGVLRLCVNRFTFWSI